jgi:hypothetical protein
MSGAPLAQLPLWQVSAPLQTSPSPHEVPLLTGAFVHEVVASLHASAVHAFPSSQSTAVPLAQLPPWQVSAPLQYTPSSQSAFVEHCGVAGARYASHASLERVAWPSVNAYMQASSV